MAVVSIFVLVEVYGNVFDSTLDGRKSLKMPFVATLLGIDSLHLEDGDRLMKKVHSNTLFLSSGTDSTWRI